MTFSSAIYEGTYYTFATAGSDVVIWGVDAVRGLIGGQKCGVGHTKRVYCSAVFSPDGACVYAGSTSGDVATFTGNSSSARRRRGIQRAAFHRRRDDTGAPRTQ